MKNAGIRIVFFLMVFTFISPTIWANEPDTVFLFSYTTIKDQGRSGLHFAWSIDKKKWHVIGNEHSYVKSDYGPWGHEKQMHSPYLLRDITGNWLCFWALNDTVNKFAHTTSQNLVTWGRQHYPFLQKGQNFSKPVVSYDKAPKKYSIAFLSGNQYFRTTTKDLKSFDKPVAIAASEYKNDRISVELPSGIHTGNIHRVAWPVVAKLTAAYQVQQFKNIQNRENHTDDSIRFAGLKPIEASITIHPGNRKPISEHLIGVFFEDINYAADGGIYAELLQNRDFEYQPGEKLHRDPNWNAKHSWSADQLLFKIDSTAPLHPNNPHYAILETGQAGGSLVNKGFEGIPLKKGEAYEFAMFAKNMDGKPKDLVVKLVARDGNVLAQSNIKTAADNWEKYSAKLISNADAANASLELQVQTPGRLMVDVLSLFPEKTFKNRKNGLRADLAETIAAIQPKFIRFPGGCVAHGDGIDNIYRWKNTIGPIESRRPIPNTWRYHQTAGLGYFEYFQFCEDVGAEPLPVLAAGVPCQNSGLLTGECGQHGGIPMSEMNAYVQEILDLVEWANGPANSKWGKLRAEAGHPAPFNLKFVGIGNEDLITDEFEERFTMIYKALKAIHPEITVIGTTGPFHSGTDYEQGWDLANKLKVPMVDEHYYESPGWFINNQDFYDSYDRQKAKVYLGEYASRGNALYNALAEALYLTAVERNADVVSMTSYAPLLAKEKFTQWNPDLIYFNNTEVKPTVNYEVQKLFGQNGGNEYLPVSIQLSNRDEAVNKRFGLSVVRDTREGSLILKMVNLLPQPIAVTVDLENATAGKRATKSVLRGRPADSQLPVVVINQTIGKQLVETLPPYSFTVWKIRK